MLKKAIIIAALALAVGILQATIFSCLKPRDYVKPGPITGPELERTKKLMRKHGVEVLYEDYKGVLWFKRDGKRIKA